jgi:hypothetical protein
LCSKNDNSTAVVREHAAIPQQPQKKMNMKRFVRFASALLACMASMLAAAQGPAMGAVLLLVTYVPVTDIGLVNLFYL